MRLYVPPCHTTHNFCRGKTPYPSHEPYLSHSSQKSARIFTGVCPFWIPNGPPRLLPSKRRLAWMQRTVWFQASESLLGCEATIAWKQDRMGLDASCRLLGSKRSRLWRGLPRFPLAKATLSSGEEESGDLRLMERCGKRGKSPCFELFVSERRKATH